MMPNIFPLTSQPSKVKMSKLKKVQENFKLLAIAMQKAYYDKKQATILICNMDLSLWKEDVTVFLIYCWMSYDSAAKAAASKSPQR